MRRFSWSATTSAQTPSPWLWVPTLYLVQAIPNSLVENVAPLFLQQNGVSKQTATGLVATAALPWALKFLWSPLLEVRGSHRRWLVIFQTVLALACAGIAATAWFFGGTEPTFAVFFTVALALCAFASATHDIAADGFYYTLNETQRGYFIGVRNAAYRAGSILPQVLAPVFAVFLLENLGLSKGHAWGSAFGVAAIALLGLAFWHRFTLSADTVAAAPKSPPDLPVRRGVFREYLAIWQEFLRKRELVLLVFFLFYFRLPEVCVTRLASFFLLDSRKAGGLAIAVDVLGWINGVATAALVAGGLLGGALVGRFGLRRAMWPLVAVMHLPNLAFVALAHWQPESVWWIGACAAIEKFGYGIGYTVFALVMLRVCDGAHRTAHYAFAASLAYLGNLLPGYWIGSLAASVGYENFFWLTMLAILPSLAATALARRNLPAG